MRLLALLLEAVQEDDAPPGIEEIDDAVDVGAALFAQFPEVVVQFLDQRLAGLHVAEAQLLHRPAEAGARLRVEAVQELGHRDPPAGGRIQFGWPRIPVAHYEYFIILT